MLEFFEPRCWASRFAAMNWPRVSFGFACRASSYALLSASGVVFSFSAIAVKPFSAFAA